MATCTAHGSCTNEADPNLRSGFCGPHYQQRRKYGLVTVLYSKGANRPCVDCGGTPRKGLGRCQKHLDQFLVENGASHKWSLRGTKRDSCVVDNCPRPIPRSGSTAMCSRHFNVWNKYRLDPVWFDEMHEEAGGICPTCLRDVGEQGLVVDHDHVTGKVRGLLCHDCNLSLGKMQDNADAIRRLADYLEGKL
jgi:hypothetical protein